MRSILTEAMAEVHVELPMPAILFGVVALVAFVVLGFVTWSYRDVANRHSHKTSSNKAHH